MARRSFLNRDREVTFSREELISTIDNPGQSRGEFLIKEKRENGRLYALICRRWCRVERNDAGQLVERFKE